MVKSKKPLKDIVDKRKAESLRSRVEDDEAIAGSLWECKQCGCEVKNRPGDGTPKCPRGHGPNNMSYRGGIWRYKK
jgi:rubrerythrin